MSKRTFAFLAAFIVQVIYGVTFTFANDVIDEGYIQPYGFILIRIIGATALFWIMSFFLPKEKIAKKDFLILIAAAFFGLTLNMLTFFKGLAYTTPINASVIMVITPVIVLGLSALLLKEKITSFKVLGIILGIIGAVVLTVYGKSSSDADNILLGNFLVFINAVSYSIYIIIIKKLTSKYHPFTFMKWLFLFGLIFVTPIGYKELSVVNWSSFTPYITFSVGFTIVATTYIAYLLNPIALRTLKASTVTTFLYIQPIIATIFAILMGSDSFNTVKLIAAIFIFSGVYLVSKPQKNDNIS